MLLSKDIRRNCIRKEQSRIIELQAKQIDEKLKGLIPKRKQLTSIASNVNLKSGGNDSFFVKSKKKNRVKSSVSLIKDTGSSFFMGRQRIRSNAGIVSIDFLDKKKLKIKRKNAILKTHADMDDMKLIYRMNQTNNKLLSTQKNLLTTEKKIRAKSQFSTNLKDMYIKSLKNIEGHKIGLLKKKVCNYKKILEKREFLRKEKKKQGLKKFKNFDDILKFHQKLLAQKKELDSVKKFKIRHMRVNSHFQ